VYDILFQVTGQENLLAVWVIWI